MLTRNEAITRLNKLGSRNQPFSFYCDFLGEQWCIESNLSDGQSPSFQLEISDENPGSSIRNPKFSKNPIPFSDFKRAFDQVVSEINFGNSFLTNLTFQTPIQTDLTLDEIFNFSRAKYRLLVPDQFVVFSPETFVKISKGVIYSYPMKGTIDAGIPDAGALILDDPKELAEHVTIVDLIRNDLSQVANNVTVSRFRYIDEIKTNQKHLIQVSSEVRGSLDANWQHDIGTLLSQLLPAGSISGAPKPETIRIIKQVESYQRAFYTGICGYFDGVNLDTGVMIRFIKKEKNHFYFCSGGGITSFSKAEKEYQEMIDKVYLAL